MNETLSSILMLGATVLFVILLVRILFKPIKWIFKLLINAFFGFVVLFLVNFFGESVGLHLDTGWINCLITGFLGVPGVVLLVLAHYIFPH